MARPQQHQRLKNCPISVESLQYHQNQARKGVPSTKTKAPMDTLIPGITRPLPTIKSQELLIQVYPTSKLYTDDMGCFLVRSCSSNHYIMLAFHVDTNTILVEPFYSIHDRHRLATYNRIMARLNKCGQTANLQILDNEASQTYRSII